MEYKEKTHQMRKCVEPSLENILRTWLLNLELSDVSEASRRRWRRKWVEAKGVVEWRHNGEEWTTEQQSVSTVEKNADSSDIGLAT